MATRFQDIAPGPSPTPIPIQNIAQPNAQPVQPMAQSQPQGMVGNVLNFLQQHVAAPVEHGVSNVAHSAGDFLGGLGFNHYLGGALVDSAKTDITQTVPTAIKTIVNNALQPGIAYSPDSEQNAKLSTLNPSTSAMNRTSITQNFNTGGLNTPGTAAGSFIGNIAQSIPLLGGIQYGNQLAEAQTPAQAVGATGQFILNRGAGEFLPGSAGELGQMHPQDALKAIFSPSNLAHLGAGGAGYNLSADLASGQTNPIELAKSTAEGVPMGIAFGGAAQGIGAATSAGHDFGTLALKNAEDFDHLASATHTLNAEEPTQSTYNLKNGTQVTESAQGNLSTISVPESQAEEILRSHNNVPAQIVDHMGAGSGPKVDITIDSNNRHVVSWTPDRPEFADEMYKHAQIGAVTRELTLGTRKPGFLDVGATGGDQSGVPEDAIRHQVASEDRQGVADVIGEKAIQDIKRVERTKAWANGKIDAANFPVGEIDAMTDAYNQNNGQELTPSQFIDKVMKLPTKTELARLGGKKFTEQLAPPPSDAINYSPAEQKFISTIESNPLLSSEEKQAEIAKETAAPQRQEPLPSTNEAMQDFGNQAEEARQKAQKPPPEPMTPEQIKAAAKSAISAKLAFQDQISVRTSIMQQIADGAKLTGDDAKLFRDAAEHPQEADTLASQSKKPEAFKAALKNYRDYTEDVYKLSNDAGRDFPHRENYYNHEYDHSALSPEAADEYAQFSQSRLRNAGNSSELPRVFDSLREADAYGKYLQEKYGLEKNPFEQKNATVTQDLADMAKRSQRAGSTSAFIQDLRKNAPGQVFIGSEEGVPSGFVQLHVPGMMDTFVSPEIYKHVKVLEPSAFADNPIIKGIDTVNRGVKSFVLQGPFHAIRESINFAGSELGQLHFPTPLKGAALFADPGSWLEYIQEKQASGILDQAAKANLKIGGTDFENLSDNGTSRGQKLSIHSGTFERAIPYYKIETFETAMKRNKVDITTPEGLADAKKIAEQTNNFYGGLNNELNGRNKTVQQVLRFLFLAPDFNEGKVRSVANAFGDWKTPAGDLARRQLAGQVIVTAIAVEAARRFATGKFDDLKSFLQNTVLAPNVPLPSAFNKPGKTTPQTVGVPASTLSDAYRAVTDPQHAVISRGSSIVSAGAKVITGKDYYGNPLVDPFKNPNPTALDNAKELWKTELPIPAQNALAAYQGKESVPTAVLNTLGGRVKNDPNDPGVQATNDYFKSHDAFKSSLNPNEQAVFDYLNPTKKDSDGNLVYQKTVLSTPAQYSALLADPNFLVKYQGYQQSQPSHDPLWDLEPVQLHNYLTAEVKNKIDPTTGFPVNDKTSSALFSTIPKDFFQKRTDWFNSLPPSTGPQQEQFPQAPQQPQSVTDFWNQYAQLPAGTGAKSAAMNSPQGRAALEFQLTQQLFTNQQRITQGLPPFQLNPPSNYPNDPKLSPVTTPMETLQQQYAQLQTMKPGTIERSKFLQQNPDLVKALSFSAPAGSTEPTQGMLATSGGQQTPLPSYEQQSQLGQPVLNAPTSGSSSGSSRSYTRGVHPRKILTRKATFRVRMPKPAGPHYRVPKLKMKVRRV